MLNAPSHNYPDEQHATVCVTHESCEWASHIMCASDRLHKRTQGIVMFGFGPMKTEGKMYICSEFIGPADAKSTIQHTVLSCIVLRF